ncbi:MAG: hypothetical protein ABW092_11480 [Candidatus Thiodiazotropha sp.]
MGLAIERLSASGWRMQGIDVDIGLIDTGQLSVHLTAASFKHDALPGAFEGISLDCPLQLKAQTYRCIDGRLSIANTPYGPQVLKVSGEFTDSEQLRINAQDVKLAQGMIDIDLELNQGRWDLALRGEGLKLARLGRQFAADLVKDSDLSGDAKLVARLSGFKAEPERAELTLRVGQFAYADVEGLRVAEDGALRLDLKAQRKGSEWRGDVRLSLSKGQFYADPFYLEVAEAPLTVECRGQWMTGADLLHIHTAKVVVPQVMESQGSARVDISSGEILEAQIDLNSDRVGSLYSVILQPLLIGSMADDLEASGVLHTQIGLKNGALQGLDASLENIDLDDRQGLFALYGLNGRLAWTREEHPDRSHLSIQGGQLYRIDFGPVDIHAHAQKGEVRLLQPVDLPLMQGSLQIDQLHAQGLLADAPQFTTSAQVKDISLQALAEAFEWPSMEGKLHGTIPSVHYRQKKMGMDGELVIDVFGGTIRMGKLLVEDPLGRVPELFADLQLSGLDLAQITQTFSFGHIQGGLEGEIAGLHLASWEPIAFDARFNTPDNDQTPHRISQRAVDNLTSLGNGVGSGLSSTFLGIFKEFRYNRIELRAKLDGNSAELGGMDHPDGGYYLVKGSGLPRIDVIARNRQVAWKTLLERLKNIRVEGMEMR